MNISLIDSVGTALQAIVDKVDQSSFIYELLLAYNLPKATIARLKSGNMNLSKQANELIWKKKLLFREITVHVHIKTDLLDESAEETKDPHHLIDQLKSSDAARIHFPRFIVVTDYKTFLAFDTKTKDSLDIAFKDLAKHADFFLPWAGTEKTQAHTENAADVKAAANMAKLYDLITDLNPAPLKAAQAETHAHALNVFLSRLLFCFFAEDTDIFNTNQFTSAVDSHTLHDGSDLAAYLDTLFTLLNTAYNKRASDLPNYLAKFKYVNGGLFKQRHPAPTFNRKSRALLIELGKQDWAQINPDIFGSMIQAVVAPSKRGDLGMHYTSVPNIMKVISPLFLDELHAEFEAAQYEPRKLDALRERISRIKVFDPACGSGNFLITAYKKLCELEIAILNQRLELQKIARNDCGGSETSGFALPQGDLIPKAQRTLAEGFQLDMGSRIELAQFYGIEIDDFAHEIATLSLWLAQHQMNVQFKQLFGCANPTLPLAPSGNIVHGNACRENWEDVCPKQAGDEIYILGNPPYLGSSMQSAEQKQDMAHVFSGLKNYKNLDFIACWFYKGAQFIEGHRAQCAFVSTNSIAQGEQVALLWPKIFEKSLDIGFAVTSFKWANSAKHNAGVTVAIIGIRNNLVKTPKYIYTSEVKLEAGNINAYLAKGNNLIVVRRKKAFKDFPSMTRGEEIITGDPLILSIQQGNTLLAQAPSSLPFIKKIVGAKEITDSTFRYCIYPQGSDVEVARQIPAISAVFENALKLRKKLAKPIKTVSDMFAGRFLPKKEALVIPRVSSGMRDYIPIGFIGNDTFVSDAAQVVYNATPTLFSLVTSKSHMLWINSVCGRLKADFRYSPSLGYNTFPFPDLLDANKTELEQCAYRILDTRERYSEKTLAQLYDLKGMPADLRAAHHENDLAVERCYRSKLFTSDEERLAYLFSEYERMVGEETVQLDLLADEQKAGKAKKTKKQQK